MKTTISIDDNLWCRFSVLVLKAGGFRKKNEVIERMIREYVEGEEGAEKVFLAEAEAFREMKVQLLQDKRYRGRFVAIYGGRVVDGDKDHRALARRVYKRYGYVPIYMGKVEEAERLVEIPSPEVIRP